MKHDTRTRMIGTAALALIAACAHTRETQIGSKSSVVSDADVGRLPASDNSVVDTARRELANANDALSSSRLEQQQAENQLQIAKADIDAAKAEQKSADAIQLGSDQSRDPAAVRQSKSRQDAAQAHLRAAEARQSYAQKLVDASNAKVSAATQRVKVASAKVEQSKLQALQRANNPAATKYDPGRFQTAVYDAQVNLDQMEKRSSELEEQAVLSRQAWEAAQREWDEKRRAASGG